MVVTTVAIGDLLTGIENLYVDLRMPLAIIALVVGGASGAFALHRGAGQAIGKVVTGIAVAALIYGGLALAQSLMITTNNHSGGQINTSYLYGL